MTEQEIIDRVDKIYAETLQKLREIEHEQDQVIGQFMAKLREGRKQAEQDKIQRLREELQAKSTF